jgi:hypothetical protein
MTHSTDRSIDNFVIKPFSTTSWEGVAFNTRAIDVDWIADGGDPCDPEKVKLLAQSYTVTGPRMPPAVRLLGQKQIAPLKNVPEYAVLTDRYQIEALKSLGASTIECIVVDADDTDACLWQSAELFNRPESTILDRAEVGVKCVQLIRIKAGQMPTLPGGRQPHDKGYTTAEKLLGVSRRDLRRFEKIAGLCSEAKDEARRAKLDDVQNALLEIAEEPAERQVKKVRELEDRYSKPRGKRSTPANRNNAPHPALENGDGNYEVFKSRWAQYCKADFAALPAGMQTRFVTEVLGMSVHSSSSSTSR